MAIFSLIHSVGANRSAHPSRAPQQSDKLTRRPKLCYFLADWDKFTGWAGEDRFVV